MLPDNALLDLHKSAGDDAQPHSIIAKYQLCYLGNWLSLYRIKRFYNFTGVPTSSPGRAGVQASGVIIVYCDPLILSNKNEFKQCT